MPPPIMIPTTNVIQKNCGHQIQILYIVTSQEIRTIDILKLNFEHWTALFFFFKKQENNTIGFAFVWKLHVVLTALKYVDITCTLLTYTSRLLEMRPCPSHSQKSVLSPHLPFTSPSNYSLHVEFPFSLLKQFGAAADCILPAATRMSNEVRWQ